MEKKQWLRTSSGVPLGSITESAGKLRAHDSSGIPKGDYDPRTNVTHDSNGNPVGFGNLLAALIVAK